MRDIEVLLSEDLANDSADVLIRIPREQIEAAPRTTPQNFDAAVKVMLRQLGFKVPDA